jgi:hypothetical protein
MIFTFQNWKSHLIPVPVGIRRLKQNSWELFYIQTVEARNVGKVGMADTLLFVSHYYCKPGKLVEQLQILKYINLLVQAELNYVVFLEE